MHHSLPFSSLFLIALFLASTPLAGQDQASAYANDEDEGYHIALEDFPSDMVINHINGWGGMTVAVNAMPAGSDLGPLLVGLKNNSCQVPHWGYILEGVLQLTYDDGRVEMLEAGELFYMPPGHVGVVVEDLKLMDFSPQKGMKKVISHIEKKIAESQN